MQNNRQSEIASGLFRRKHVELFWASVAIFVIALEQTADRYLSPFHLSFLDSLKSDPVEIRHFKQKVTLIVILGFFSGISFLMAFLLMRVGVKTNKAKQFPYPGKFCLFDTSKLEGDAAIKKGKEYIRAAVVCILLSIVLIYHMDSIFKIKQFLAK